MQDDANPKKKDTKWLARGLAVAGGLAVIGVIYYFFRSTQPKAVKRKSKPNKEKNNNALTKFKATFSSTPVNINLCMDDEKGAHAHVCADAKNKETHDLQFGARVIKINDQNVADVSYKDILLILKNTPVPITFIFKKYPDLEEKWTKAESLKESANKSYSENDVTTALKQLEEAINLHPTNKIYYSNRILMYLKNNDLKRASQDCETIERLDPLSDYKKGIYLKGLVLFHSEKYQEASVIFEKLTNTELSDQATKKLKECEKKLKS